MKPTNDDGRTYYDHAAVERLRVAERAVIDAAVAWEASLETETAKAAAKGRDELGAPEYYDASYALWCAVRSLREVTP